jgi:uncharacterized membrane protein YfcA
MRQLGKHALDRFPAGGLARTFWKVYVFRRHCEPAWAPFGMAALGKGGLDMLMALGLGSVIGAAMALSGAGGGILAVPLLMFGLGLNLAQAAPVGLLAVGMAACLGAFLGLRAGLLRYRAALLMATGGVLLAPVGIRLASRVDNRWLSVVFAFLLFFVAWRTFRQIKDIPHDGKA